jgi:PAS domain S-box-containing protein
MEKNEEKDGVREELVLDQDNIYEIDLDGVMISWNRGAELLYGWGKNEVLGKPAYELFKTEFHLNMYEFITKTIKNYIWTGELEQFKHDGKKITVLSHAILHRGNDGKPAGIIFANTDITKLRAAEDALKQSEEKYAVTLRSIGDAVMATDNNGIVTFLNPVAEQMTGWTQTEAEGRKISDIFHIINYDTRKPSVIPIKETLERGITHGFANHTILISRKGNEYDIADSCAPILSRAGNVAGAVLVFRDITGQMEKEKALEEKRKELETAKADIDAAREYAENMIDTIREPLIALDQDLRVVSASRSFYEFFKEKSSETIGQFIYDIGDKRWDIPELRQKLETILPQKASFDNYEVEYVFADIGRRVMLLNAKQIQRGPGKERVILLAIEDITMRRNADYILNKINRALRAISNTNQALMHEKSEQNYIDKVCRIIVKDCGYKMAWIGFAYNDEPRSISPVSTAGYDGSYLKEIKFTWGDGGNGNHPAGKAVRTRSTIICRDIMKDPDMAPWCEDGKKRGFISIIALPFRAINRVSGVLMLYSGERELYPEAEVKLLEELASDLSYGIMLIRARNEKNTAELEIKKIAAFPRLDPNPISEIDPAGKVYYTNPAFRKLFPNAADSALSHGWFEGISQIFSRLKGSRKKIIRRAIKIEDSFFLQTMVYMPEEGTIRTYGEDITIRKNAEIELKRLYVEVERKVQQRTSELLASKHLADLGTLAATVAHELRNPLGVINLATYNLKKKTTNRDMLKHLSNIEKKVNESGQIINNLLVYAKMKIPQFENTNIYELITECAVESKKHFGGKKISFKSSLKPIKGLLIGADPLQLKEVFTNIINNAYQAIDGKTGSVEVKAKLISGKRMSISVKDTGVGIHKDDMGKMFKPFFTRKTKGTGLGLVICRDIINMHDGTINIASKYGKGSTFTVILPLRKL